MYTRKPSDRLPTPHTPPPTTLCSQLISRSARLQLHPLTHSAIAMLLHCACLVPSWSAHTPGDPKNHPLGERPGCERFADIFQVAVQTLVDHHKKGAPHIVIFHLVVHICGSAYVPMPRVGSQADRLASRCAITAVRHRILMKSLFVIQHHDL